VSLVGVVTNVTSAITGAVVSVVEDELSEPESPEEEVELSVLAVLLSSLLLQEKTVRLKREMRIMYKTLFIFFITSNERK
jgi:hypothetical protein